MEINKDLLLLLFFVGLIIVKQLSKKAKPPVAKPTVIPENTGERPAMGQNPGRPGPYSTPPIPGTTLGDLLEEMLNPGRNTETGRTLAPRTTDMGPDSQEQISDDLFSYEASPSPKERTKEKKSAGSASDPVRVLPHTESDSYDIPTGDLWSDLSPAEGHFNLKNAVIYQSILERKYF